MSYQPIVWITIDSVRRDHMTLDGYPHETTPNIEAIANRGEGEWLDHCISQGTWTPASSASILSGTYLSTHGVGYHSPDVSPLSDDLSTIAELLQDAGYRTAGISTTPYLSEVTGMNRGFKRFAHMKLSNLLQTAGPIGVAKYIRHIRRYGGGLSTNPKLHNRSYLMTELAKRWVDELATGDAPFFLYLHYLSPHYPYTPPRPFAAPFLKDTAMDYSEAIEFSLETFDDIYGTIAEGCNFSEDEWEVINALYDAELALADELVGYLFDYLTETKGLDPQLIITADHGELLGEDDLLGHHISIHGVMMNVPLVTYNLPIVEHNHDAIQHIDLTKTVVENIVGEVDQFEGVNLHEEHRKVAFCQRPPRIHDMESIREKNPDFNETPCHSHALEVARDATHKLVVGDEFEQLYKLQGEEPVDTKRADGIKQKLLDAIPPEHLKFDQWANEDGPHDFDDETMDQLDALGYV